MNPLISPLSCLALKLLSLAVGDSALTDVIPIGIILLCSVGLVISLGRAIDICLALSISEGRARLIPNCCSLAVGGAGAWDCCAFSASCLALSLSKTSLETVCPAMTYIFSEDGAEGTPSLGVPDGVVGAP